METMMTRVKWFVIRIFMRMLRMIILETLFALVDHAFQQAATAMGQGREGQGGVGVALADASGDDYKEQNEEGGEVGPSARGTGGLLTNYVVKKPSWSLTTQIKFQFN